MEPSLLFWTLLWQTGLEKVTSQFSDCQICLEVFSLVIHRKEYLRWNKSIFHSFWRAFFCWNWHFVLHMLRKVTENRWQYMVQKSHIFSGSLSEKSWRTIINLHKKMTNCRVIVVPKSVANIWINVPMLFQGMTKS